MSYQGIGFAAGPDGLGAYYTPPGRGHEGAPISSYRGFGAFGFVDFDAQSAWAQAQAGAKGDNYQGKMVANQLRAVLSQLGYGVPAQDVAFGTSADCAAFKLFLSSNGLTPGYGLCGVSLATFQALAALNDQAKQSGHAPGPLPPKEFYDAGGGTFLAQSSGGTMKAGMGTGTILLLLGAVGLGVVAVSHYHQQRKGRMTTTMAHTPNPFTKASPEERKRRRRRHYWEKGRWGIKAKSNRRQRRRRR